MWPPVMSGRRVFQAKCGPWLGLVRFLLLSTFLLTPPALGQSGFTPWPERCIVTSSWCSGSQADQTTTFEPPLKYSCHKPDFTSGVPGRGSAPGRYVTQAGVANRTGADTTVAREDFVNVTDQNFTVCDSKTFVPVYVRRAASINFNITSGKPRKMCLVLEAPEAMIFRMQRTRVGLDDRSCYKVYSGNKIGTLLSFVMLQLCSSDWGVQYTRENVNFVEVVFEGGTVGRIQVEAVSAVSRPGHFGAFCYSEKKGFIQAPADWDGLTKRYLASTISCITLEVPEHHALMISFVRLYLPTCVGDWLSLHKVADCQGVGSRVCGISCLINHPTVYHEIDRAVSFRFTSSYKNQTTGFRIMYSFHPTYAKPEQLPNGSWNCSVRYFSDFQQHFQCRSQVFCQDERDVKAKFESSKYCGRSSHMHVDNGSDPFYIFSNEYLSWEAARNRCQAFGLRLAHLDTPEKWAHFLNVTADVDDSSFYVGYKASVPKDQRLNQTVSWDSRAVPFFKCDRWSQLVPYSLVCDHRHDCFDGSDEDFCTHLPCAVYERSCMNEKQCILMYHMCDGRQHCVDGLDEFKCDIKRDAMHRNMVLPPAFVTFTGHGDFRVDAVNSPWCPDTHFLCPGYGYCLPVFVLCNGVFDCPGKEDELRCDVFTCPGFYRCRNSRVCVHNDHLCDHVAQCPQQDDERYCKPCPENCTCHGFAYFCTGMFKASTRIARYVDASGSGMTVTNFDNDVYLYLIHLTLRHCNITAIGTVNNLPNLKSLDLSYNLLITVTGAELGQLVNLRYLSLAYNSLMTIDSLLHTHRFPYIYEVNLAGLYHIPDLTETFFSTFPNLRVVNVSDSGVTTLSQTGFQSLKQLHTLDVSGCKLQIFSPVFHRLEELEKVVADNYKFCCPAVLPDGFDGENCFAPTDEISSCDALLRSEAYRVFLTVYALLSLVGNLGSFIYRNFIDKSAVGMGFDVFVTHLSVSDFLMGVYLAIVGLADRIYYGNYVWNDVTWRHSAVCKVAGFLSFLSSEMSAFLICLITLERFLVFRFPFSHIRFSRRSAHAACVALWIISFVLSAVPLLPAMKHWEFYSQSGICIPLPITRKKFPGADYSFSVMIGLNFVVFVLIAVGQGLIYSSIRSTSMACRSSKKSQDMTVARNLLTVVMTDFLCWFPIGLLGIMSGSGLAIPGDVNVGMAIFVLPLNSALNPFLYTFNVIMERRRRARHNRLTKGETAQVTVSPSARTQVEVDKFGKMCSKSEALAVLKSWLDGGVLSLDELECLHLGPENMI